MKSYNRIIMIGNLTRDPEFKQLQGGHSSCRLGIAANREFAQRNKDTKTQETCFIDVDIWGSQAESCHKFLKKGRSVLVEGRLKLNTWQNKEGQTISKHCIIAERIVFLDNNPKSHTNNENEDFFFE